VTLCIINGSCLSEKHINLHKSYKVLNKGDMFITETQAMYLGDEKFVTSTS
jgi:hypothetical protein